MNIKRLLVVVLILLSLSCNAVTQVFVPPTPTPTLTPTPTITPTATVTPTPTATPLSAGLYIPPDCQSGPVATLPPATTVAEPTLGPGLNPVISTAEQLRVFDALTKQVSAIYLYPDFNGLNWKATVADTRAQIKAGLDTETFYAKMSELITKLGDNHSSFLSPKVLDAENAALNGKVDYVGIGILVQPLPEKKRVTILSVLPGSSAEHGGLKAHDSLLAVDGIPLLKNGVMHTEWIRGPECSAEVLTVQSPGQEPRDIMFMRFRITAPVPIVARLVQTSDGSRIGYIFLPSFFDETIPGQVKQALRDFGTLDGLIIDNRMNGGGSSDIVEPILGYFTSGVIGHFVSRTATRPFGISRTPIENSQDVPLVILVGKDTVSFGEIFSGALQDIKRAKVVGQTSAGNVELLSGYDFEDGSRAWIARERFDPLNSHVGWEGKGVVPDVVAYADWDTFTFETDPAVAAAVKLLGHK